MKIKASRSFRYRVINFVAGKQSPIKSAVLRAGIFVTLLLLLVPPTISREIVYAGLSGKPDLKSSLRMMLWLWNRSWIPFQHPLVTYYDIGWVLSEKSCQKLCARGFLMRGELQRQCDLAQYALSELRAGVLADDANKIALTDQKIATLVGEVLSGARRWAISATTLASPIVSTTKQTTRPKSTQSGEFDNQSTRSALLEFDDLCNKLGQSYFLVSGTFLGVVRDGAFIGHDNDIDVGVFEGGLQPELETALRDSDHFVITKVDHICRRTVDDGKATYRFMGEPAIIKIVHLNGVSIDIFNHFHEVDVIWHGDSYHRWDNRRFALKEYEFLGRKFLGAEDFDLYLTENYGADWRVPQPEFDSSVDTPNLSYVGSANGLVFFACTLARFVAEGKPDRVLKYVDMLQRVGACRIADDHVKVA